MDENVDFHRGHCLGNSIIWRWPNKHDILVTHTDTLNATVQHTKTKSLAHIPFKFEMISSNLNHFYHSLDECVTQIHTHTHNAYKLISPSGIIHIKNYLKCGSSTVNQWKENTQHCWSTNIQHLLNSSESIGCFQWNCSAAFIHTHRLRVTSVPKNADTHTHTHIHT